jgi:hypothetical protein
MIQDSIAKRNRGIRRPHFKVPTDTNPLSFRCIQMSIPDDLDYTLLFKDALEDLTNWNFYQHTGTPTGSQTAQVWRNVINAINQPTR